MREPRLHLSLTINGRAVETDAAPAETLLDLLRRPACSP